MGIEVGVDLGGGDLGPGCPGRSGCEFIGKPMVFSDDATYADCHHACSEAEGCDTWAFKPASCEDSGLAPAERALSLCWLKHRGGSGGRGGNPCRTSGVLASRS